MFKCGHVGSSGSWSLLAANEATIIPDVDREKNEVDPENCKFNHPEDTPSKTKMDKSWG